MDRTDCIDLINAAHVSGRLDYARSLAADWLSIWPGDLEVQLLVAETDLAQARHASAAQRLLAMIVEDPEYARAYELLGRALVGVGDSSRARLYSACASALHGRSSRHARSASWIEAVAQAVLALRTNDTAAALAAAMEVIRADPDMPLPIYLAMRAHWASGDREGAFALARTGHDRWPDCIPFKVLLAIDLFSAGQTSRGVEYLHQVAAQDSTGRIIARLLGEKHDYRALWPETMSATPGRPVPAEVLAVMGRNKLAGPALRPGTRRKDEVRTLYDGRSDSIEGPERSSRQVAHGDGLPQPEPWESFRGPSAGEAQTAVDSQAEQALEQARVGLDQVASRINIARPRQDEDPRRPVYLVLTSKTRLIQAFGEDHFNQLDRLVRDLCRAVSARADWCAYPVYIDDPASMSTFGLEPADPANAWQIKFRLADLDQALAGRGEMIAALLIVGGHQIIPFHLLPNPTDDDDDAVPSDNPYAITDDNYFAPEWPVGRLPSDNDPLLLENLLERITAQHLQSARRQGFLARLRRWLRARIGRAFNLSGKSLGYSASIWRKASMAVFRTIGDPQDLITSPPVAATNLPSVALRPAQFSYFNLHGLEDAAEWFGQRDPLRDDSHSTEFPIALQPSNVLNGGRAPQVVYTEACYGANSLGKTSESALCLRFLAAGSHAVIGSTKISYGSVTPPLIAADLLGKRIWDNLERRLPAGEALRRSKLEMVEEMYRRQGYLDGEDQKTLISFVLYGDPLFTPDPNHSYPRRKSVRRLTTRPSTVKTACALGGQQPSNGDFDALTAQRAREIVARYLPGMSDAHCRIRTQACGCQGEDHLCPTHQLGLKSLTPTGQKTLVVTFSKQIPEGRRQHAHYARLTLDQGGKVLKLAVSR